MSTPTRALSLLLVLAGCKPTPQDTADTEVTGEPFTITVTRGWRPSAAEPVVRTGVAFDDGDGRRFEVLTDDDGVAVLQVDWTRGPIDLVVDGGGFIQSLSGVDRAKAEALGDEMTVFFASDRKLPRQVQLSGTAGPRTPEQDLLVHVLDDHGSSFSGGQDHSTWEAEVLVDRPFSVLAIEFTRGALGRQRTMDIASWTLVDHEAVSEDTTVDLDLSQSVAPTVVSGTVATPNDAWFDGAQVSLDGIVYEGEPWFELASGWATATAPSLSGFQFSAAYVDVPGDQDRWFHLFAVGPDGGSEVVMQGSPETWTEPPTLLPVPRIDALGEGDDGNIGVVSLVPNEEADVQRCAISPNSEWIACADSDLIRVPEPPSTVSSSFKDDLREFTPFYADRAALAEDGYTLRAVAFGPNESL